MWKLDVGHRCIVFMPTCPSLPAGSLPMKFKKHNLSKESQAFCSGIQIGDLILRLTS